MRIRELTLRHYRVHAAPEPFRFSDNLTVVAGVNGKGKTALLDALALLCSRLLPLISPARSGHRTLAPADVTLGARAAELALKANCAGIPIDYKVTYRQQRRRLTTTELPASVRRAVRAAYGDPQRSDDASPLAVYYTTDRASYRVPRTLPTKLPRGQAAAYAGALFSRAVNFRDFMARYRSAVALEGRERQRNPHYIGDRAVAATARALTTFLGGFDNLRVEEAPLRLLIDKNGSSLDLSQLSDGERSFVAMICDLGRRLALANPDARATPNPLHGAGVVLIDELELHLHPKWQREICQKLRDTFPNIQFIATTHSPFVIQSLRPGELINLDPEEFGEYADKSIEDIAENVMGVDVPQKSERYLEMRDAAEEYFRLLREPGTGAGAVAAAEAKLNELSTRFSDDPAFQALLKLERETHRPGGADEAR